MTEENRQKFLQALGTLMRKSAKRVIYHQKAKAVLTVNTAERQAESCSAAELRRKDKTIFYGPGCEKTLVDEQVEFFNEVTDEDGDFSGAAVAVAKTSDFKTPQNLVIADAGNERKFVRLLTDAQNAKVVGASIKNASQRFYPIEFAWKKRRTPQTRRVQSRFFHQEG